MTQIDRLYYWIDRWEIFENSKKTNYKNGGYQLLFTIYQLEE